MQPQVVHEAEVHRQHIRLQIPITIEIDGARYTVDDWSMGGFGINSEMTSRQPGERFPARMIFPFEDFEVSLRVDCQMVYIVDDNTRFGCKFFGLSQGQVSLFRYLIDAYLTGEIVSGGDLLEIAGRDNTAIARQSDNGYNPYAEEESLGRSIKRWFGYTLLLLVGVGLAGLIAMGAAERFLTVRADSAVVEAPTFRVRAPIAGVIRTLNHEETVSQGQMIGEIVAFDGLTAAIESPCDCLLIDWLIEPGQFAQPGEGVVSLVAADRPLLVRAQVELVKAESVSIGDIAEIRVPGQSETLLGQVENIDFRPRQAQFEAGETAMPISQRLAQVTIRPDRPFELSELGALVAVSFP